MKLTIITINKDNAVGLQKTMQSVFAQTWQEFEYIVIDGASTDSSVDIIKTLLSRRALSTVEMHWVSEPDNGIYHAMNKGIRMAKGEYLLFLNSGDCLANDRVLEEVLLNEPDADIVSGNAIYESSEFHKARKIISPKQIKASDLILSYLPHQATFIKRVLFDEIHFYDEDFKVVSDWAFFIEAILKYGKSYRHIQLFVSRCDAAGISSNPANIAMMEQEFYVALKKILPLYYDDFVELRNARRENESINYIILQKISKSIVFRFILKVRKYLLRYGYYSLKAKLKRKLYLRKIKKEDEAKKVAIRQKIYELPHDLLQAKGDETDIIVSLTSHGKRVRDSLPYALYSIFTQEKLPNKILVFLDDKKWNSANLPTLLRRLQLSGLEVVFTQDIGPHSKFLPALKMYPNNAIITLDDDMYYEDQVINTLNIAYQRSDKKSVIACWAEIVEQVEGKFAPYSVWHDSIYGNENTLYSPLGVGGVLYPPHIFDEEIFKDEVFIKLAPYADDIWFWVQEYRCGVKVKLIPDAHKYNIEVNRIDNLKEGGSTALYFQNCLHGRNDKQFKALLEYYNLE